MTEPEWREVRVSSEVIDQLISAFENAGYQVSESDVARSILEYVREVFRENWYDLPTTPAGARSYRFVDDAFPYIMFYGRLVKTVIYDLAIVEDIVEVFHVVVVPFDQPLEDPDDPTPDR